MKGQSGVDNQETLAIFGKDEDRKKDTISTHVHRFIQDVRCSMQSISHRNHSNICLKSEIERHNFL